MLCVLYQTKKVFKNKVFVEFHVISDDFSVNLDLGLFEIINP